LTNVRIVIACDSLVVLQSLGLSFAGRFNAERFEASRGRQERILSLPSCV